MTCEIGEEMDENTSVITLAAADGSQSPRVLDIGMAPGGFAQTVLRKHRDARIRGITLPSKMGGLRMMLPGWKYNLKIRIEFVDIMMLANEMGCPATSLPTHHPDIAKFSSDRPFRNETFDLVFCGATGATTQRAHAGAEHHESHKRLRLATSQLVFALQRLRNQGSLVLVMHKPESFDTAEIIRTFTKCSSVRLFKSKTKHAITSSFYMVAMDVDTQSEAMQSAILEWKKQWEDATFQSNGALSTCPRISEDQVREMLAEFGPQLIDLAMPLWKTQADALRASPFLRESNSTSEARYAAAEVNNAQWHSSSALFVAESG
jgi:23S rRNA U2552 (ribose-2'-O)-methylase RlmE/FtsJ